MTENSPLSSLTSFELYSRQLHKEKLPLSLFPALQVHHHLVLLLLPAVKVELLVQESVADLLHLLAVPVLLAHLLQNGQGLSQFGASVPRVAVLGRAAHHVQALQDVHDVVDAAALDVCAGRKHELVNEVVNESVSQSGKVKLRTGKVEFKEDTVGNVI